MMFAENIGNMSQRYEDGHSVNCTEEFGPSASYPNTANARYIWNYCSPILLFLGTFGNIMTIIVLFRKSMWRMSSAPYLMVLSVADIIHLYTGLLRQWIISLVKVDVRHLSDAACRIHTLLVYTFADFSVWILVAVSVERFISVCFPFKAKTICSRQRAFVTMAVILCTLTAFNCHFLFGLNLQFDNSPNSSASSPRCASQNEAYHRFYVNIWPWMDLSVFSLIPFIIIITCNIGLLSKVRLCERKNQLHPSAKPNSLRPKPSSMTVLLIILNSMFLITTAPISIYLIGYPKWKKMASALDETRLELWWAIVNQLGYLNNTLNFILYCVSGPPFRRELRVMCGRVNKVGPPVITPSQPENPNND